MVSFKRAPTFQACICLHDEDLAKQSGLLVEHYLKVRDYGSVPVGLPDTLEEIGARITTLGHAEEAMAALKRVLVQLIDLAMTRRDEFLGERLVEVAAKLKLSAPPIAGTHSS